MSYSISHLKREIDINKILDNVSQQKAKGDYKNNVNFLFVSLWDKWSEQLVEKLKEKYTDDDAHKELYVVNSFDMPHAFTIFGVRQVPALVRIRQKKVIVIDRLPVVYSELKV